MKRNLNEFIGVGWESLSIRGLSILNNRPAPMIFSEQPTVRLNWFASSRKEEQGVGRERERDWTLDLVSK